MEINNLSKFLFILLFIAVKTQYTEIDIWQEQRQNNDTLVTCYQPFDNRYGTTVKTFILADENGLQMNKDVFKSRKKIVLHGVWPEEICEENGEKRIRMKPISSKLRDRILAAIKSGIYQLSDFDDHLHDFSSNETFWYHEYVKHYYKNGFTVDKYLSDIKDVLTDLKNFGLDKMYPHSIRFNEFNYLEQVVQVEEPESVYYWNYKSEAKNGRKYKNPVTGETYDKFYDACVYKNASNVCYRTKIEELIKTSTPIIETVSNIITDKNIPISAGARRVVNEGKLYWEAFEHGDWEFFAVKIIGTSVAVATSSVQYLGKIKTNELYDYSNSYIGYKILSLITSSAVVGGIGWYFEMAFDQILEQIVNWLVTLFLLNCIWNILSKFNKVKTVFSVISAIICVGVVAYLQLSQLIFEKTFDYYYNVTAKWDIVISKLINLGYGEKIEFSNEFLDFNKVVFWLNIMRYILVPTIIIYAFFRQSVSKIITKSKNLSNEYITIGQMVTLNIAGVAMFLGTLWINYDFFRLGSYQYSKQAIEMFIDGAVSQHKIMKDSVLQRWLEWDIECDLTPVFVAGTFMLIGVISQLGIELCSRQYQVIRASEITLFITIFVWKFEQIFIIISKLFESVQSDPMIPYKQVINLALLMICGLILQLWINYTTPFIILTEFLVFIPIVKYFWVSPIFGIHNTADKLLTYIGYPQYEHYLFLFVNLCCVCYINHNIFGLPAIYRHITSDCEFVEEKAWKKGIIKIFVSIFKVISGLIGFAYLTQYTLPLLNMKTESSFSFTMVMILLLLNLWFALWNYQMYIFFTVFKNAKFGRWWNVKLAMCVCWATSLFVGCFAWLIVIGYIIGHLTTISLGAHLFMQLIPYILSLVIITRISYIISPLIEKLRYWLLSIEFMNHWSRLFVGVILDAIRSHMVILIFMCKWVTFIGSFAKMSGHIIKIVISHNGPWWTNYSLFFSVFSYLGIGLMLMDLMFNIIIHLTGWLNEGIGFKWVEPYIRLNVDNIKNNASKPNYLDSERRYGRENKTIWNHLCNSNTINSRIKQSNQTVNPNESNSRMIKENFRTFEVDGDGDDGQEDVAYRINGNLQNRRMGFNGLDRSETINRNGIKLSTSEENSLTQIFKNDDALKDLGISAITNFVKVEGFMAVNEWTESGKGCKHISGEDFNKISATIEGKSWYCPFLSEITARLDAIQCQAHLGLLGVNDPNASKPIIDVLDKSQKLSYKNGEFTEYDTINVETRTNKYLECLNQPIITPFSICSYVLEWMGFGNLTKWVSENTFTENLNPKYILTNVDSDAEMGLFDDHIYTMQEWMLKTKNHMHEIIESNKPENISKAIHVFVNNSGKLYVTNKRSVATNMLSLKRENGECMFSRLQYKVIDQPIAVRPSIITTHLTLATETSENCLHFKLKKGIEILHDNNFGIFLSGPIDVSRYPGSDLSVFLKTDYEKRMVIGACTGLIYLDSPTRSSKIENEYTKNKHFGSCSIVRDRNCKHLYVITNRHVVRDPYGFNTQHFKAIDGIKKYEHLFGYRQDIVAIFGFGGKTIEMELIKPVIVGNDVAVFTIDNKDQNSFVNLLNEATGYSVKDIWDLLPYCENIKLSSISSKNDRFDGKNGACLLSSVRQSDRVCENDKSKVSIRMTILQYDENRKMYEILGYSTPGMSGSPIWQYSRELNLTTKKWEDRIYQVGITSACEKAYKTRLHMTNFVELSTVGEAIEFSSKRYDTSPSTTVMTLRKYIDIDAILPCRTEKMNYEYFDREKLRWCNGSETCGLIDTSEICDQFSKKKKAEIEFDTIFTNQKFKKYYDIYDNEFAFLDLNAHVDTAVILGQKKDAVNKERLSAQYVNKSILDKYGKVMDLDLTGIGFGKCQVLDMSGLSTEKMLDRLNISRDNKFILASTNQVETYLWVPDVECSSFWHVYIGHLKNSTFCNYELLGKYDYITVDTAFMIEAISNHFYIGIEDWMYKFSSIGDKNTVYTAYNIDGTWVFDAYERNENHDIGLELKDSNIKCSSLEKGNPLLVFEETNNGQTRLAAACEVDEVDVMGRIKQIMDEMKEIKDNEKLVNNRISKIRSKILDYQQTPDYIERQRQYAEALEKYNADKELYKQAKDQDDMALKKLAEAKREIEIAYVDKIKALRNKRLLNNQTIKERKEELALKNQKSIQKIEDQINVKREMIKKAQEQIKSLQEKKKVFGTGNDKLIKRKIDENEKIGKEIQELQEEKQRLIQEKNEEKQQYLAKVPEKPSQDINPEMDEVMKELRKEQAEYRRQMNKLQSTEKQLKEELASYKKKTGEQDRVIECQSIQISELKNTCSLLAERVEELAGHLECRRKGKKEKVEQEKGYEKKEYESEKGYSSDNEAKKQQGRDGRIRNKQFTAIETRRKKEKVAVEKGYEQKIEKDSGGESTDVERKAPEHKGRPKGRQIPTKKVSDSNECKKEIVKAQIHEEPKPQREIRTRGQDKSAEKKEIVKTTVMEFSGKKEQAPRVEVKRNPRADKSEYEQIEVKELEQHKKALDEMANKSIRFRSGILKKLENIVTDHIMNGKFSDDIRINTVFFNDDDNKKQYYLRVNNKNNLKLLVEISDYISRNTDRKSWKIRPDLKKKVDQILEDKEIEIKYLSDVFGGNKIAKIMCDSGVEAHDGGKRDTHLTMVICKESPAVIREKIEKYLPAVKVSKKIIVSEKNVHEPWVKTLFNKWVENAEKRFIPDWLEQQINDETFFQNFSIVVEYEGQFADRVKSIGEKDQVFCLR